MPLERWTSTLNADYRGRPLGEALDELGIGQSFSLADNATSTAVNYTGPIIVRVLVDDDTDNSLELAIDGGATVKVRVLRQLGSLFEDAPEVAGNPSGWTAAAGKIAYGWSTASGNVGLCFKSDAGSTKVIHLNAGTATVASDMATRLLTSSAVQLANGIAGQSLEVLGRSIIGALNDNWYTSTAAGAVPDAQIKVAAATMTSGSAALTVTGAGFTSADVGKTIAVAGAGAAAPSMLRFKANVAGSDAKFNVGATVTGAGGATATIAEVHDWGDEGVLYVTGVTGTFVDGEVLTDNGSPAGTAKADGTVVTRARRPLVTTISAYTSSTQVTLAATAQASVSSVDVAWGTDNTTVLQAWIDTKRPLLFDDGPYLITGTLSSAHFGQQIRGLGCSVDVASPGGFGGVRQASLVAVIDNAPALEIGGAHREVSGFGVVFFTRMDHVAAVGVRNTGTKSHGKLYQIRVWNAAVGVGIKPVTTGYSIAFDWHFENIDVNRCSEAFFDLRMIGGGATGLVMTNCYGNNGDGTGDPVDASTGVLSIRRLMSVQNINELDVKGLHFEWVKWTDRGVLIQDSTIMGSVHMEGVRQGKDNAYFWEILGSKGAFDCLVNFVNCRMATADGITIGFFFRIGRSNAYQFRLRGANMATSGVDATTVLFSAVTLRRLMSLGAAIAGWVDFEQFRDETGRLDANVSSSGFPRSRIRWHADPLLKIGTTAQRPAISSSGLVAADKPYYYFDTTLNELILFEGTKYIKASDGTDA